MHLTESGTVQENTSPSEWGVSQMFSYLQVSVSWKGLMLALRSLRTGPGSMVGMPVAEVVVVHVEEILLRRPGWRLRLRRCTHTHTQECLFPHTHWTWLKKPSNHWEWIQSPAMNCRSQKHGCDCVCMDIKALTDIMYAYSLCLQWIGASRWDSCFSCICPRWNKWCRWCDLEKRLFILFREPALPPWLTGGILAGSCAMVHYYIPFHDCIAQIHFIAGILQARVSFVSFSRSFS